MKITLATIGKFHNKVLLDIAKKYTQRIRAFVSVEIVSFKTEQKFLEKVGPRDEVVLLEERGQTFSSPDFAKRIYQFQLRGIPHLIFVVGPAEGFSETTKNKGFSKISLSSMTLQHEQAFLILTEQLYRAFTLLKNIPYHK